MHCVDTSQKVGCTGEGERGTGWVGSEGRTRRKEKNGKRKAARTASMDPTGGVEGAPTYTPVSKLAEERLPLSHPSFDEPGWM